MRVLRDCWFLAGPTAAGKSAVGVELARQIGAEIVSMDSMALYRGMDIGTAKPMAAERREVPHHLIDVLDPWEEFSLAQYVALAEAAAEEVAGRGREGAFSGGNAPLLEGPLAGHFPRAAPRLGPAPAARRPGPATRRRLAPPAAGRGRSNRRRPAAPERYATAHSGAGSLREDGPAHQRVAAAVPAIAARGGVPGVRARLAPRRASRPDRPPRPRDVRRRAGRGSPRAARR